MADQNSLERYVTDLFAQEDDALRWAREEGKRQNLPNISIQPFEGRLLQMLMYSINASKVVEIGTLAGYSGTWLARALPADGHLYTLEAMPKHAKLARETFTRAGVAERVTVMEGEALQSLDALRDEAPFDMVFIDADKDTYAQYLAWSVENLRDGGIVAAHNAFRRGGILDPQNDADRAIQAFNRHLAADERLHTFIIGVGDGMSMGIKRTV